MRKDTKRGLLFAGLGVGLVSVAYAFGAQKSAGRVRQLSATSSRELEKTPEPGTLDTLRSWWPFPTLWDVVE